MAIGHIPPFPLRVTQGTKLSSQQHDSLHESMRQTINALIDQINSMTIAAYPAGISFEYAGTTLPNGRFLWEDGTVLSRTLYPELFAVISTNFNTGGETGSQFRLPNRMGKVSICSNPMNGQTAAGLSTRTFASYIGAESNSYTPTITVNSTSPSYTPSGTVTLSPYTPSGTSSGTVTLLGAGTAAVNGVSCVNSDTSDLPVISCDSTLTVSIATIAAGITPSFVGTFTGATSTQTASFTGASANLSHTHTASSTAIVASTIQPAVVKNFIITY